MEGIFKKLALLGDVWVLWGLVLASVASLGLILERAWIFRLHRLNFANFLIELEKTLDTADIRAARKLAAQYTALEARVALAGLAAWSKGAASVEESMTARLVIELSQPVRGTEPVPR